MHPAEVMIRASVRQEVTAGERTVAIIIRSQKLGSFQQNHFEPASNEVTEGPGPTPVPYEP